MLQRTLCFVREVLLFTSSVTPPVGLQQARRFCAPPVYDVCIVGAGPAGLTAAIRLKQNSQAEGHDVSVLVLEKGQRPGVVHSSACIFNACQGGQIVNDTSVPLTRPTHEHSVLGAVTALSSPLLLPLLKLSHALTLKVGDSSKSATCKILLVEKTWCTPTCERTLERQVLSPHIANLWPSAFMLTHLHHICRGLQPQRRAI
jgi:hypothetical protein